MSEPTFEYGPSKASRHGFSTEVAEEFSSDSRDSEIVRCRSLGMTLAEIGTRFGISRERVRQIVVSNGGPDFQEVSRVRDEIFEAENLRQAELIGGGIRAVLEEHGPMTAEGMSEKTLYELGLVNKFWPADLIHMKLHGAYGTGESWKDEQILDALREAAIYEFPLTFNAYVNLLQVGQISGPSGPRIWQRFGSWTAACDAAGVVSGRAVRDNYQSKWTDLDILRAVSKYLLDPEAPNSAHRFDEWKRQNLPDAPSFQTVRNRFGSWTTAKRLAIELGESADG